ncbi:hypothetical protein DPMN_025492 [Dreissena polymorpha]|uniref:Prolyl 4-hydroxylase alpha subunit Fe(2+) 2OG dioxygenase domain-containing protein n=1 Tax=Dreissena polymorpha TaxID=45954 RepID=A0A9D4LQV4_DREPO|nr:hypothetical protein DPMN_025492 [Dreissena polymorpha]
MRCSCCIHVIVGTPEHLCGWWKTSVSFDSPRIDNINRRISAITGLNVETAEELQIANYGIGGQYEPHFDFARAGGATVFPYLGLKMFPKKWVSNKWIHERGQEFLRPCGLREKE